MTGWVPMDAATWPFVVELLEGTGKPWPEELCRFDLRWLYDQRRGILPGRRALSRRWRVSDRTARRLLADVGGWWDPAKGGVPPLSRERPAPVPPASRERPAPEPSNLDNGGEMSRPRPGGVPPVSRPRPAGVHTRVDPPSPSPSPSPSPPSDSDPGVPKWVRSWLRTDGKGIRSASSSPASATFGALGRTLDALRGKPGNVVESAARPILRLWRELLEAGVEPGADLEGLVEPVALIGDACQRCPDPIFARDVRGEGWENGRDRSRNIGAICRLAPKEGSSGATWQERLEVARAWDAAGRPLRASPSSKPSSSGGEGGYLHRLAGFAGGDA